jgi:hypothetical protein
LQFRSLRTLALCGDDLRRRFELFARRQQRVAIARRARPRACARSKRCRRKAVVRLALEPGMACVEAVRWFSERNVEKVVLDRAGHVLASHGPGWQPFIGLGVQQTASALTVLDADSEELDVLSELAVESSASLLDTIPVRVLFRISAGLLVLDLDDASAPRARAFFRTYGWLPRILIDGAQRAFRQRSLRDPALRPRRLEPAVAKRPCVEAGPSVGCASALRHGA